MWGLPREEQDNQCPTGRPVISATLPWSAGLNIRRLQLQEDLRHTANTITPPTHHHLPQQHNQPSTPKDTAEARHLGVVPQEQTSNITIYCTLHNHEQPEIPKLSLSWTVVLLWKSFESFSLTYQVVCEFGIIIKSKCFP